MDITYDDQPTAFVAVVREHVAMDALAAFYDRAYRAVLEEVAAAGLAVTGPAFGWYRDMPTDSVDLAAGFWVDADSVSSLGGGVEVVELPGGPAVVGTHVGSYDGSLERGPSSVRGCRTTLPRCVATSSRCTSRTRRKQPIRARTRRAWCCRSSRELTGHRTVAPPGGRCDVRPQVTGRLGRRAHPGSGGRRCVGEDRGEQPHRGRLVERVVGVAALRGLHAGRAAGEAAAGGDGVAGGPQPGRSEREAALREPGAAREGVVDEDRGLLGVDVQRGRQAAEVPPVARREQGEEADRRVLGGVQGARGPRR